MLLVAVGALLATLWISGDPVLPLSIALGGFVVLLSFFAPDLLLYSRAQERQEKIQNALADTLDQMTISVEAGLGFEAAMAKAATNGKRSARRGVHPHLAGHEHRAHPQGRVPGVQRTYLVG